MEELNGSPGGPVARWASVRRLVVLAACVLLTVFGIPQSAMAASPAAVSVVAPAAAPQVAAAAVPQAGGLVPAAAIYPGARSGQLDILLDSVETERVAKSIWGGAVICWPMAVAGLGGPAVAIGAYGSCIAFVTVCAARAYLSSPRARAGMTVSAGGAWCWKY